MQTRAKHIGIDFESVYIQLREKEKRIYMDDEVARLPGVVSSHPHFREWELRKKSARRLIKYLKQKKEPLSILEAGCGNGWLSAILAAIMKGKVTGLDINGHELAQAQRVFNNADNLQFIYGDLRDGALAGTKFNIIVFAAAIQYFPSFDEIIHCAFQHLLPGGEVHLVDSHFYHRDQLQAAKLRSGEHFESLGYPAMSNLYYHHCIDDLKKYNYQVLYNPSSLLNKLKPHKNPFYHFCLTNT